MSLKFKILDERNTTTVVEKDSFKFYSSENRTLRVQIIDDLDESPRIIATAGTFVFTIPASPSDLTPTGVIDGTDRSILTVALTQANTLEMISGSLVGEITEGTDKRIVRSYNILKKLSKTAS